MEPGPLGVPMGAPAPLDAPWVPQLPWVPHGYRSSPGCCGQGSLQRATSPFPAGTGWTKPCCVPQCPASCQAAGWQGLSVPGTGDTGGSLWGYSRAGVGWPTQTATPWLACRGVGGKHLLGGCADAARGSCGYNCTPHRWDTAPGAIVSLPALFRHDKAVWQKGSQPAVGWEDLGRDSRAGRATAAAAGSILGHVPQPSR